jgi:hypothetical protein
MRVEIYDWNCQAYTITSRDPKLIGEWFAEHAQSLMTADARAEIQIRIWPQDQQEHRLIGPDQVTRFTQDGLLHLAQVILDASQKLAELESSR